MKNQPRNRYGRPNNNNRGISRPPQTISRFTALDSSGPCGKLHGTPLQLAEKYQASAKDFLIQNDLVLAELCQQYADHYMRLQNQAIANEQAARAAQPQRRFEPAPTQPAAPTTEPEAVAAPAADEPSPQDQEIAAMDLSIPIFEIQDKK